MQIDLGCYSISNAAFLINAMETGASFTIAQFWVVLFQNGLAQTLHIKVTVMQRRRAM